MKKFNVFFVMMVFLLALSLGFISCDDSSNNGDSNSMVGTWRGNDTTGEPLTLTLNANSTFSLVYEWGSDPAIHGTYTISGNLIFLTFGGMEPFPGMIINNNTLLIDGVNFTRSGGGDPGGITSTNVVGIWEGTEDDGETLTLTLNSNLTFSLVYEWGLEPTINGTYTVSGNIIFLTFGGMEPFPGMILSNNMMLIDGVNFYRR